MKYYIRSAIADPSPVAPLAGAWIEMCEQIADLNEYSVAPLAGAWIEISDPLFVSASDPSSLPSRERGLK